MRESLLGKGYSLDVIDNFINLWVAKNAGTNTKITDAVTEATKTRSILSTEERSDLKELFNKLENALLKTKGSIDNFDEKFEYILDRFLNTEEKNRVYAYLNKLNVGNGSITSSGLDYISTIEAEIKTQRTLGNEVLAQDLERDLIKEKARIDKYSQEAGKTETKRNKLINQIDNLKKMAELASATAGGSISDVKTEATVEIADTAKSLQKVLDKLNKKSKQLQTDLNALSLKEFLQSSRTVSTNLRVKLAKEAKALREIKTGFKRRKEFIDSYIAAKAETLESEEVTIDLSFMLMLVGQTPVQDYIHNTRARIEDEVDMSDLSPKEAIKILRNWESRMINGINNGYYSSDLSLLNNENLTYLKAIATGNQILDLSNPNLLDMVITPDMLPSQALALQQLQEIPKENRAETAKQLSTWLESTIHSLQSLQAADGFKGTIPEVFLRIALHQKLFDVASSAFNSALKQTPKKRDLRTAGLDELIGIKGILASLGIADVENLPEFKDAGWQQNFQQLVAFDIETDDKVVSEVRSVQLETYDNGVRKRMVFCNVDGRLVNTLEEEALNRSPLTAEQLNTILSTMETHQNNGFKVISHNGNGFDFKNLGNFDVDRNLLMRVSLRSVDLQRNLGFDNRGTPTGPYSRSAPGGAQLKALAESNLPDKSVLAYGGKVTFRNGSVNYTSQEAFTDEYGIVNPAVEESLSGDNIQSYWNDGNETGDFTKFDAYAQNDTILTIDLALHFAAQESTDVKLSWKNKDTGVEKLAYSITTGKPRSNLFLAMSPSSDGQVTFSDINKDLLALKPEIESVATAMNFSYALEYDLDRVIAILEDWLIQAWAIDPVNKDKLKFLENGLAEKKITANTVNEIIIDIAQKNRVALTTIQENSLLKRKFKQFGYIDRIIGEDGQIDFSAFTIDNAKARAKLDEVKMYSTRTSEVDYESGILDHFVEYINNADYVNRRQFGTMLRDKFKVREQKPNEPDQNYFKEILPQLIKKYVKDFKRLSDFGNGTLDWKPAYDIGIAIAQVLMDKQQGIKHIDNILISEENITNILTQSGSRAIYEGRTKNFIIPEVGKVNFSSPFGTVDEERSYDNWRLMQRVKFIMSTDIPSDVFKDFATTPSTMDKATAISYFIQSQINTVFPDIRTRSPFDNLKTLDERKILGLEFMHNIPRLLSVFNHDCIYWGLNAGGRFLSDKAPVYYKENFLSAGAPTAAAVAAGAIDQIAHMSVFDFTTKAGEAELMRSITAAVKLLRSVADPNTLIEQTNKSDYKYSGLHITTAAMQFYRDASFAGVNVILTNLGLKPILTEEQIVSANGLEDPRYKAIDLMAEDLELLQQNREAYKNKHRLSDLEIDLFANVVKKFGTNRDAAKEFLKGAITPRFYQAGFKGIKEGLETKNKDKNYGLTNREIRVVTKVLLRQLMASHLILIDQAIGLSDEDTDVVKDIFLSKMKPVINRTSMQSTLDADFFGEMEYVDRLKAMNVYFTRYVDLLAEQITPRMEGRAAKVLKVKEQIRAKYKDKLDDAAKLFNKVDLSTASQEQKAEVMNSVNQILAGSMTVSTDPTTGEISLERGKKNGYEEHLVLWALNRRASTSYKLLDDNLELQRLVTGVHIDPEDYAQYLNKAIFHTYGLEIASGRNHMFGNWGNGPESSKLAQIRVEKGKEANPLGIWDITDDNTTPAELDKAFQQQVMLDLAPYYLPPGYTDGKESRDQYWDENDKRSTKEREAQAFASSVLSRSDETQIGSLSVKDIKEKMTQFAGIPEQRFRMRTLASSIGNPNKLMSMDSTVEGLPSYRPTHADQDFSQRSVFALVEMQHRIKEENLRESQLLKRIKEVEKENTDVNSIIPKEHRGHVPIFNKQNLPFLPQQTSDTISSIITGPTTPAAQRAIRIRNSSIAFAKTFGWDNLLESKDWTRLFLLRQLRSKAFLPAIKVFDEGSPQNLSLVVDAKAKFFDGFFKTLGTRSKVFISGKNFSTIDLMLTKDKLGISYDDIKQLREKHGESLSWLTVLTHLGSRIDRLAPIKFGLVMDPGIVVRGTPSKVKSSTRSLPINIFGLEIRQIYKYIMTSEVYRITATEYLQANHADIYKSIKKDVNGFVFLEDLPIDETIQLDIAKKTLSRARDLALELNSKFTFVLTNQQMHMLHNKDKAANRESATVLTGPLATQARAEGYTITDTAVSDINTLWAFTEDMTIQMLNSLANNELMVNVELANQTNKDIGTIDSDLDTLVMEQERQQFAQMSAVEEETFAALLLLHKTDVDTKSTQALIQEDYRKVDKEGNPLVVMNIPAYFTAPIPIIIDGDVHYATLEDSVYITDLLQSAKLADQLGMEQEAREVREFLKLNLMATQSDIELDEDNNFDLGSQPVIKLASLFSKLSNSLDAVNKRQGIVDFVQPGLSVKGSQVLQAKALKLVRILNRIDNTQKDENNKYYYMALAHFDKMTNVTSSVIEDKKILSLLLSSEDDTTSEKEKSKAISGIKRAYREFTTMPQRVNLAGMETDFKTNISQFSDKDKFIEAFGNTGENIVNQLQGMVTNNVISQKVMDMKLIMIGTLAMHNRGILEDLNLETRDDMGSSEFARASKKNNKYTIGLNIQAMAVTPENEILLKFAEELVHIARIKYMDVNSHDMKKIMGAFNTVRSKPMIREMLMAMNKDKPYDQLEKDVEYATKNVEEFLSHYGAMILLQETVYRPDVLTDLEAKYDAVYKVKNWWNRAFNNIKYIAKRSLSKFTQLKQDPYYGEVYDASYSVIQNLLFSSVPAGRIDVGNPDMQFSAFANISTTSLQLTAHQKEAVLNLQTRAVAVDRALEDPSLSPASRVALRNEQQSIKTQLIDPTINPISALDMRESEIQENLSKVVRVDNRVIERRRPDDTTRALLAETLNNWSVKRGARVDNSDTLAGLLRRFPDEGDRLTTLLQNTLIQGFNQTNITYNSPESLLVMISDLIDNWMVTTQSTYLPSTTSGGFMANKLGLDGYMGRLRHETGTISRLFNKQDARERINLNVIQQLHGLPITISDANEISAVNSIVKYFTLWHNRLGEEMVNARIKSEAARPHLDPVGLKLSESKALSKEERDRGFNAVRNLIRNKALKNLDTDPAASVVSPYVSFMAGHIANPDLNFSDQADFSTEYEKFIVDPSANAINAKEAIMKLMVNRAIKKYALDNPKTTMLAALDQFKTSGGISQKLVQDQITTLIFSTREHETSFAEAYQGVSDPEMQHILNEYRGALHNDQANVIKNKRFNELKDGNFGFYMGETPYAADYKGMNSVVDALTYEFFGKLGATAYLFDSRSPMLTSRDILLDNDPKIKDDVDIARKLFDTDIDSVALSLLRGVGYDTIQRVLTEQASGIPGFTFTIQQLIDMTRGVVNSRDPSSKIRKVNNLDNHGKDDTRKNVILLGLDRLETANKDARGTLGTRNSEQPVLDALAGIGRVATQIAFGPNIPVATWVVEGAMGAVGGAIRGDNPLKFLLDAIDQNIGSFITNTVGDLVRIKDGKVGLFNVDPPKVRGVAQNCLWLFEEIYSPMLPGKLTADAFSSEMIDRMSSWERFLAWQSRSQSNAMKAIRVASENQANRRIAKDLQNRDLFKLRDSVNKLLRNNPNPSNKVLREVVKDSGVKYNIEVLLAFVRAGLFDEVVVTGPGGVKTRTGILETIDYLASNHKLDRGTIPMMAFFDIEYDLLTSYSVVHGTTVIDKHGIRGARTAMMKAMKSYANMAMVINHPLDGTASATAHHVILNFYKSYPTLFTSQFLIRRGSVTPGMQFAFELLVYTMLDMSYNILLSLASGYYNYEKLKQALAKREMNYQELMRLVMKFPIFSNNLLGLGMQNLIPVLNNGMNKDMVISSVAESAIGYDIRNVSKALQGWAAYANGDIPKEHPMMATYNVLGRVIPGIGSTLVKMLLMQSFGDLNYSGRTSSKRSPSSFILDKIGSLSDDAVRETAVRSIFKNATYKPMDKRLPSGEYLSTLKMTPKLQEEMDKLSKGVPQQSAKPTPKPTPQEPKASPPPPVVTSSRTPSLKTIGSNPIAPPTGML